MACFEEEGDDTDGGKIVRKDGSVPKPDTGVAPAGVVTIKKAGQSAVADFSKGKEFLVVPYSTSGVSGDIDFVVKVSGSGPESTSRLSLRAKRPESLKVRNPALWLRWENRLKVERWTRHQAEIAAASRLIPDAPPPSFAGTCQISSTCKATEVCHNGNCVSSVTVNVAEFAKTSSITAEVKAKGKVAAILVDKGDTVPAATLTKLLNAFEKTIYPRDTTLFGNPVLKTGATQKASDRNADGLVWLVLTKKVSDKMAAVGFFNAVDFSDSKANSNKADILYVDTAATATLADVYPIMAHEFQHLLNFAVKKYKPTVNGGTGALEALWLDEGQAHFAEDACGYGGENVTLLDQEVFTAFEETAVFTTADSKAMRGMALLFVRYLFEQAGGVSYSSSGVTDKGGAAFLQKLRATSKQGTAAVDSAFGSSHKTAFANWLAAVGLDGRGVTSYKKWIYQPLVTDPVTGNTIGIKIRGTRKDNTGANTTLSGPLEEDLSSGDNDDSIPNATGKYFKLKGKTGKVTVTVTSKGSDLGFLLLKVK